jgi:DNA-binding transcriptional regulator PaaX
VPVTTSEPRDLGEPRDLIDEIHDLDEEERAAAYKRWIELSKLVAPPAPKEQADPEAER